MVVSTIMMSWLNRVPSLRKTHSVEQPKPTRPCSANFHHVASSPATTSFGFSFQPDGIPTIVTDDADTRENSMVDLQDFLAQNKSTTLQSMVDMCIRSFDETGEVIGDVNLVKGLFLVHKWYLPSSDLAQMFVRCYQTSSPWYACSAAPTTNCQHDSPACASFCHRAKICHAIREWIQLFPMHFDSDPSLVAVIAALKEQLLKDGYEELSLLLDTSSVSSYAWLRNVSVRNPVAKQISLAFVQWTPDDIGNSLTHVEHKMLRRITFAEYKEYASTSSLKRTPILERSIAFFNSLSQWVQCMILSKPTPRDRADMMTKFINVAKRLRKLQNFNTLMSVVGGISHSAMARLTKTQACLSAEARKDLQEYTDLLSSASNFSKYRQVLAECRGFRIPIVGVHLKDLICLHTATADYVNGDQQINCKKMAQLALVFSRLILDLEKIPSNLPEANMDLINTLKVSLYIQHSDDDIYDLSMRREPKTFLNASASCKPPVVFADWAAGVSPAPDMDTIKRHVTAMVEAVFKHYDNDGDGLISRAEFKLIVGNFPFIDAFGVIDADRDNMINKQEMVDYFVKVNKEAVDSLRKGFQHNFHEFTFLAPTTCCQCGKLLWGPLRQGMKCKDCGIPVHRTCKGALVLECRRKSLTRCASLPRPVGYAPVDSLESLGKTRRFPTLRRFQHERTVSTSTPTPEPETDSPLRPEPLVLSASPDRGRFLFSSYRQLKKQRCFSEEVPNRPQSPGSSIIEILPSLASEEVFEEDSSTGNDPNALGPVGSIVFEFPPIPDFGGMHKEPGPSRAPNGILKH